MSNVTRRGMLASVAGLIGWTGAAVFPKAAKAAAGGEADTTLPQKPSAAYQGGGVFATLGREHAMTRNPDGASVWDTGSMTLYIRMCGVILKEDASRIWTTRWERIQTAWDAAYAKALLDRIIESYDLSDAEQDSLRQVRDAIPSKPELHPLPAPDAILEHWNAMSPTSIIPHRIVAHAP